jgi:hypothetical protein
MHPTLRDRDLCQHAALRLGRVLQLWVVLDEDVRDHDVGAGSRQGERILPAQASRSAGDDSDSS